MVTLLPCWWCPGWEAVRDERKDERLNEMHDGFPRKRVSEFTNRYQIAIATFRYVTDLKLHVKFWIENHAKNFDTLRWF